MDLSDVIGSFGPWQLRVFCFFFYVNMVGMWQTLSITFLAPNVHFRCITEPPPQFHPYNNNATISTPQSHHHNATTTFDNKCDVLVANQTTPCTRWEYDIENFSHTIVSEWDLVCDRQWLVSFAKSVYMFGFLVSVISFGQFSDWMGRLPAVALAYVISCSGMFLALFSTSYEMFAALRFVQAFGRTGMTTTGMVLVMELMGPQHRTKAGVAVQFGWALGFLTLPMFAYFIRHWFWLQMTISLSLVPLVLAFRIVPESPRWLLMRGKKKRLEKVLIRAAAVNKMKLTVAVKDLDLLKEHTGKVKDDENAKTLFHVLKMPKMRNRVFIMIYAWMVNAFMYYGLSFNTNDIAGNPYLNFFVSGALEFPSYSLLYWGIVKAGRRPTLVWLMMVGGLACLAILAVPDSVSWLQTVFAMTGKFCVTASFGLLYIYTNELFPTVVRNVTLGSCSMCARIGSILAPFVRELGQATHPTVPNVLYGVLALTTGLLALLLPETMGRNMPDTMEEGETFGESCLSDVVLKEKSREKHLLHSLLPRNVTEINGSSPDRSDKSHHSIDAS